MGRPKNEIKSVSFAIRVPVDVRKKLDLLAFRLGVPVTALCRCVICEYVDEFVETHHEELESIKKQKIMALEAELLKLKGEHA